MESNWAKKIYPYLASLLLFIVAFVFMMGLKKNYEVSRQNHHRLKVEYLSYEFSNTFREMVLSRTKNLEIFAQTNLPIFGKDEAHFHRDAEIIQQEVSGFAAINWVAPDGTIRDDENASGVRRKNYEKIASIAREGLKDGKIDTEMPDVSE